MPAKARIFVLASDNLETFAAAYRERAMTIDAADAHQQFGELFEQRSDGTTRLREKAFQDQGITGFIGRAHADRRRSPTQAGGRLRCACAFRPGLEEHGFQPPRHHARKRRADVLAGQALGAALQRLGDLRQAGAGGG